MPTKIIEGEILTIKQVADYLKVTERTIYRLAGRGGFLVLTLTAGSNSSRWKDSPSDPMASSVNRAMGSGMDGWTDSTRRALERAGGSPGQAGVMAAIALADLLALLAPIVLGAAVASSVLFLEEARKLLQKILSSRGEHYA